MSADQTNQQLNQTIDISCITNAIDSQLSKFFEIFLHSVAERYHIPEPELVESWNKKSGMNITVKEMKEEAKTTTQPTTKRRSKDAQKKECCQSILEMGPNHGHTCRLKVCEESVTKRFCKKHYEKEEKKLREAEKANKESKENETLPEQAEIPVQEEDEGIDKNDNETSDEEKQEHPEEITTEEHTSEDAKKFVIKVLMNEGTETTTVPISQASAMIAKSKSENITKEKKPSEEKTKEKDIPVVKEEVRTKPVLFKPAKPAKPAKPSKPTTSIPVEKVEKIENPEIGKKKKIVPRKSEYGNYVYGSTGFALNTETSKFQWKESDDGTLLELTDEDKEKCRELGLPM
jgi:hypothetical protein